MAIAEQSVDNNLFEIAGFDSIYSFTIHLQ